MPQIFTADTILAGNTTFQKITIQTLIAPVQICAVITLLTAKEALKNGALELAQ